MYKLSCIHLLKKKKKSIVIWIWGWSSPKKRMRELDLIFGEHFGFWVHNSQTLSLTQKNWRLTKRRVEEVISLFPIFKADCRQTQGTILLRFDIFTAHNSKFQFSAENKIPGFSNSMASHTHLDDVNNSSNSSNSFYFFSLSL